MPDVQILEFLLWEPVLQSFLEQYIIQNSKIEVTKGGREMCCHSISIHLCQGSAKTIWDSALFGVYLN